MQVGGDQASVLVNKLSEWFGLADESHSFEVWKEWDGPPPRVRPVNKERLPNKIFSFDVMVVLPRSCIAAGGAIVTQDEKLVIH